MRAFSLLSTALGWRAKPYLSSREKHKLVKLRKCSRSRLVYGAYHRHALVAKGAQHTDDVQRGGRVKTTGGLVAEQDASGGGEVEERSSMSCGTKSV